MTEQDKVTIKIKPDTKEKLETFQSKYQLKMKRRLDNNEAIAIALDTASKALRLDENGNGEKKEKGK